MICKIQVVIIGEDGREETRELACLERTDLKPETLGLTLAEGKMILKGLQQIVVERQVSSSLLPKRACPDRGQPRHSKGNHTLSLRTVFGRLSVRSARLHQCTCQPHQTKIFSPLAEMLPEQTTPELLFLETKWASLMSYGMTSKLLQEVLPIDEPVSTFTIRQHVADVAERLERELGEEQSCFIDGTLLVSNNSTNGTINGFSPKTGGLVGTIRDQHGRKIIFNNTWGIVFGGGTSTNGAANELFVTVGPGNGAQSSMAGTFASIVFDPK